MLILYAAVDINAEPTEAPYALASVGVDPYGACAY
jgi:hypothetical protein